MCGNYIEITLLMLVSVIVNYVEPASIQTSNSTLQLVHVIFRHGERTTDSKTMYPKDPHINETYYPYGLGELTLKGKKREYELGKLLRKKYDQFLGAIYTSDIVEGWSSETNRTKMSLQLVLAGLFPPSEDQIWEAGLNWQPIPFNVLPYKQDLLFFGLLCPNYKKLRSELLTSPKMTKEFELYSKEFEYISQHSGLIVNNYWDVFFLYLCLTTEKEYGLTLPKWTGKVYPQPLQDFATKSYGLLTATTQMRRITSGTLLKKIVDDTKAKINKNSNRKIFLYSGHELNIAFMLHALEVFEPHIPPYGSHIIFEVHRIDNVDGIKIYYGDYSSSEPRLLKLPACDQFCPLEKFVSLVEEYFPVKDLCNEAA